MLQYIKKPKPDDLINAFSGCKKVGFKKNEFLFHMGDQIQYLDLLVEGELQVFKYDGNMNEMTLHFFKPVVIVAEWAVIQGIPYPASGRFTKRSIVYRMPTEDFQEKLNKNILLNHILMYSLVNKIDTLNVAINRGLTMDSLQRVAHFLYHCTDDSLILKQNQIASLLYLRPETFSRILKQFKDMGIITTDKGKIELVNREGLRKYIS
jgi:CRP/FNR family transcriptional regulator